MKFFVILFIVAAFIGGLLLTLRTSRNSGMPGEDVIKRARERNREQDSADEEND